MLAIAPVVREKELQFSNAVIASDGDRTCAAIVAKTL